MKQWQLADTEESGKAIMEENDVVMYIDDLNPEMMAKVVQMHNEGKTIGEISLYLTPGSVDCTQEQHDYIIEQIDAYLKITNQPTNQPTDDKLALTIPTASQRNVPESEIPLTKQQKAALTRKANAAVNNVGKKLSGSTSAQNAIKALEDKIALIRLLDSAEVIDIPTGLDKSGRDILLEFQKEQQTLIDTYLEKVKNL